MPFPGWARKEVRQEVLQRVWPSIEGLPDMKDAFSQELGNNFPLGRVQQAR